MAEPGLPQGDSSTTQTGVLLRSQPLPSPAM